MFYLNTIEQLFLFVEQLDQLEVCLPYSRLLTGISILAVFQNLRWNSNKTSLCFINRCQVNLEIFRKFHFWSPSIFKTINQCLNHLMVALVLVSSAKWLNATGSKLSDTETPLAQKKNSPGVVGEHVLLLIHPTATWVQKQRWKWDFQDFYSF